MKLTDEQRTEIEEAVTGMALSDWDITDADLALYAGRVTWWLEHRDAIEAL